MGWHDFRKKMLSLAAWHKILIFLNHTFVLGSCTVTPSTEIVSSTLGVFCPSAFFICLLN